MIPVGHICNLRCKLQMRAPPAGHAVALVPSKLQRVQTSPKNLGSALSGLVQVWQGESKSGAQMADPAQSQRRRMLLQEEAAEWRL